MAISNLLKRYMDTHGISYQIIQHPHTQTSMETAEVSHIPGDKLAKSVLLEDEKGYMVAVIPSTHRIDFDQLRSQLSRFVDLAVENKMTHLFADCELGAIPPVGAAYGIDTIVDDSLIDQTEVYFEAGDHEALVHVTWGQFNALMTGAHHGEFSRHL